MNFIEPKVEIINVALNEVVYRSNTGVGGVEYCNGTQAQEYVEGCTDYEQVFPNN